MWRPPETQKMSPRLPSTKTLWASKPTRVRDTSLKRKNFSFESISTIEIANNSLSISKNSIFFFNEQPFNIKFESFIVEVSKNRSSIESQARQARYKIFESLLDENDQILLAHHRDDVFETILLRLFRGTGVDGLSGLNEKRSLGKGEIIRPFLNLSKSDLEIFVHKNDLPFVEDDTNLNNDFDRNFLRNEIIPSLEKRWSKLPERAALTSLTAKKKKLSLDFMLEKNFKKEISTGIIERAKFIETPSFLIEELIRLILRKKGIALPSQKVLSEIMNVFFHKKPSNESYVEWSRKDGEQIGGKVFSEHNDIILKKK